jgi:hypothetical protein
MGPRLSDAGTGGGPLPDGSLAVDAQLVDFGSVVVHTNVQKPINLTNSSSFDLTITPSTLSGPSAQFFSIDQTSPFTLKAMTSAPILAAYAPMTPSGAGGEDRASFTLSPKNGAPVVINLQGNAVQSALQISPNPLDFNFVQPGQQRTLWLTLNNVGNLDINISSIAVTDPGTGQVFALTNGQGTSLTLPAKQSVVVSVTFSPNASQQYTGELQIMSDDNLPIQSITLKGYGGGAAITCTPTQLDFPTAAAGFTTTLPVICTNTGTDIIVNGQPDPNASLQIMGFNFSNADGGFSAAIDSSSPQGPLLANQSALIDVSYTPTGTETDSATMTVLSNVNTPPAPPVIALAGQAIQEQKCFYNLTPILLSFGQVVPVGYGDPPYTLAFTIENTGPNECLINGLNLVPGTDSAFSVTGIPSQRLSPPGTGGAFPTELVVPVTFVPEQIGDYTGLVGFTISDPDGPDVKVQLSGTVGQSCFKLMPDPLAFGVLGPTNGGYCGSSSAFVATNGCTQTVTLSAISVTAAADAFSVDAGVLPLMLNAGHSASVVVSFTPMVPGDYFGAAQIQTDTQQTPFEVFFTGTLAPSTTWTDSFRAKGVKADILWVMDTADSDERHEVAKYATDLINALEADGIDFQIGVTSSDVCSGGKAEDGRLVPCTGCHLDGTSIPQVITGDDANAGPDLATLMGLGGAQDDDCATGDDEQLFEATYQALVRGTGATANAALGFIRPGALLAVIAVNGDNADDESNGHTPDWYAQQFQSIKGATNPGLFSWSYVDPSQYGAPNGTQPFNRLPERISSMLTLTGGVALDTTVPQWYQGVSGSWNSNLAPNNQYVLSGTPDPSSIKVYLDGPPPGQVPDGGAVGSLIIETNPDGSWNWRYDATNNAIEQNPTYLSLQPTDTLYVEYTLVCP